MLTSPMTWLPPAYLEIDPRIRVILAEQMEHGATDELDRKLMALVGEQKRIEQAGWFS